LNDALRNITDRIGEYNQAASRFKNEFAKEGQEKLPAQLDHMTDFEGMQSKIYSSEVSNANLPPTMIPGLVQVSQDYERLKKENEYLQQQLRLRSQEGIPPETQQNMTGSF